MTFSPPNFCRRRPPQNAYPIAKQLLRAIERSDEVLQFTEDDDESLTDYTNPKSFPSSSVRLSVRTPAQQLDNYQLLRLCLGTLAAYQGLVAAESCLRSFGIASWWAENARLRPYRLVLPQNSAVVSTALTALVTANDGAGDWHIAVRSGGHSLIGSNNIVHGVTIDLSMMNSSSYDYQASVAKIEPGGRWKDVYADLEKQGVTVADGRDGSVGVGGFLLGGGNLFFSGRVGFCDSVVNFEVVLVNGTGVDTNSTANADLWRALKGGSSNFGIVTRFDMEAILARNLYYDLRILSSNYSDAVTNTVVGFADQDQSFADNALVALYGYNTSITSEIYANTIYVNTLGSENIKTAFDNVEDLSTLCKSTVLESMAEAAAGSAATTLTFHNDPQNLRLNYADASQDHLGSYGLPNVQYMRDVAARYDLAGVFQLRVPGGFKILRVA
ncbi:hypothetical protein BJ170DRAFT_716808 [Xylariales sp. AK1849]|nr:hypothetical protein BJ170DRAFT_716808 [Xylariales sp. AK1849]